MMKILVGNRKFNVEVRPSEQPGAKTKVYVFETVDDDQSQLENLAATLPLGVDSIHQVRGKFPVLDKAWDRFNAQIIDRQRLIVEGALAASAIDTNTLRFSRKAGCACGCSPGWNTDHRGREVFITEITA